MDIWFGFWGFGGLRVWVKDDGCDGCNRCDGIGTGVTRVTDIMTASTRVTGVRTGVTRVTGVGIVRRVQR